ncbi:right-handed parallel beta-helix repeat-containing protein [Streptacidiphilus jiangxiensis]|uniref:Right handed beta helix region n=1 Tax=Streptacidiphilus jiangxiensis TaxID=235985 RepID=A0A1H7L6G0_STRJI|nr:right-handed parallel beta-helix repeat-containing protein [Streptacidiphilus jiangxiensis]SEK94609.1 Right handed beta helix region [Streptacidiphilus jiangxiensis]
MTDSLPSGRHAWFRPFRGNPRRRTLVLLLGTGVAVLGVNFAIENHGDASTRAKGPQIPTFYVSATGDDNASGTTPGTAWRTLTRVDQHVFKPSERLLLHGGDRFTGHLTLKAGEAGQAAKPVQVGSYGSGRATIVGTDTPGLSVFDTAGVEISDLVLTGPGVGRSLDAGIDVFTDLTTGARLAHVSVARVDVSGFRDGIAVSAANGAVGFSDVAISDSTLHGNRDNGLVSYGGPLDPAAPRYAVQNLRVTGVQAYANLGNPRNRTSNSGSGIAVGSADGALVQGCVAFGNGTHGVAANGPVGIWAYDATKVVMQHNVSHDNHTGGSADGGGFDLDRNTTDSVIQANLSFDNDGPGFMDFSAVKAQPSARNTIRFNVSRDDSRKFPGYGSVDLSGWLDSIDVHHNTVVQTKANSKAPLLKFGLHITNSTVRDNLLSPRGGAVVDSHQAYTTAQLLLQGNEYDTPAAAWRVVWGTSDYGTLTAWRAVSHQEVAQGKGTATIAPARLRWTRAASWDPTRTPAPELPVGSALLKAGLDLRALFGDDPGATDYFGAPLTVATAVGATQPAP